MDDPLRAVLDFTRQRMEEHLATTRSLLAAEQRYVDAALANFRDVLHYAEDPEDRENARQAVLRLARVWRAHPDFDPAWDAPPPGQKTG